ncbi:MAG TPA: MFS transporter [Polyangia bacterium]|nr:MFS transporter [Polyangia bacterium]
MTTPNPPRFNERTIVFLVGAVQFVNILDFVMVMPLGPDFAAALSIPESKLGLVAGSYTAAASISGIIGSYFLDRFDRRSALGVAMLGLVAGTAAGGLATGLPSLLLARVIAGVFGGPATSLAFSIIADVIPPERRGKAMGAVMGAFSVAQVLGVPAGLWLAQGGRWWLPFFVVAGLGLVIIVASIFLLPPLRLHLESRAPDAASLSSLSSLLARPIVRASYLMTATVMMAGFLVIPNIAAYVQKNLHYPRSELDRLYLAGGVASFLSLRIVGAMVDRFGSFRVGSIGSLLLGAVLYLGFYDYPRGLPVMALFIAFMIAMAFRNVSYSTLTSKVPEPIERARFMSIQSSVQHGASALGAIVSSRVLVTLPGGALGGMSRLTAISIALTALLPAFLFRVERAVQRRAAESAAPVTGPALAERPER